MKPFSDLFIDFLLKEVIKAKKLPIPSKNYLPLLPHNNLKTTKFSKNAINFKDYPTLLTAKPI